MLCNRLKKYLFGNKMHYDLIMYPLACKASNLTELLVEWSLQNFLNIVFMYIYSFVANISLTLNI